MKVFFFFLVVNENSDINQMTIVLIPFVALFASLMEMGAWFSVPLFKRVFLLSFLEERVQRYNFSTTFPTLEYH